MSPSSRRIMAALIVLGCVTSLARADDKDQIEQSFKALITALANGDGRTAKGYVVDEENNQRLAEAMAQHAKLSKELYKAAVAQFGKDGEDVLRFLQLDADKPQHITSWEYLDKTQIAIHGDAATVPPKPPHHFLPALFKKRGALWKMEIQPDSKKALKDAVVDEHLNLAYIELIGDTKRGKYRTAKDLKSAWNEKTYQAINQAIDGLYPSRSR